MKKTYASPSLAVYGKLEGITLGVGGSAPDVPPLSNVACVTGTATTTSGGTVTITCATQPSV